MTVRAGQAADKVTLDATATADVVSVSVGGGGSIQPDAKTTGSVEAFLGAPGGTAGVNTDATKVVVSGSLGVTAYSDMHATSHSDATAVGGVEASIQDAHATAGGATRAYAGDGADIDAGTLGLTANSALNAEANTQGVTVGIFAGSGVFATSRVTSATEAYLGKNADDLTPGTITVNLSGATTLTATSNGTANATARGAGGGVADVNVITPSAEVNGKTRVYVGPDTTLGATSVTGTADATTHANAYATLLSISAVDVTLVHLSTDIHQDTSGFIGTNADVTATGAVSLTATSHNTATSTTSSL